MAESACFFPKDFTSQDDINTVPFRGGINAFRIIHS